ncbi:PIKALPHA Phosphatidylinositol 4-kinase PIK1alpha [Candida maltosa Xu316]
MSDTSPKQLLEKIRSPSFSLFNCIFELKNHSDSIGIQHELVQKLYTFPYEELEFFIPQIVQLLVVYDRESMALEEFLLKYSSEYPHFSLIVFWNLQAYIFELRNDPDSRSFQTVRNLISKVQNIMFNTESPLKKSHEFRENIYPAMILCGSIASAFGVPDFHQYSLPIIKTQSRQQKSLVFKLANFQKALTKNLTIKNQKISRNTTQTSQSDEETPTENPFKTSLHRSASVPRTKSEACMTDDDIRTSEEVDKCLTKSELIDSKKYSRDKYAEIEKNLRINTVIKSKKRIASYSHQTSDQKLDDLLGGEDYNLNSKSLPDLSKTSGLDTVPYILPIESESSLLPGHNLAQIGLQRSTSLKSRFGESSFEQLVKVLQVNYSKNETQFIMAMQNISIRLSQVPKEARLSALRAELSIINESLLPSEIDIPQLLPVTSKRNKKYHKILKLNINEACVLNSAERVPFLLLIEYLSDEIDFNPFTEYNQKIISNKANLSGADSKLKESITHPELADFSEKNGGSSRASLDVLPSTVVRSPVVEEADLSEMSLANKSTSMAKNISLDKISEISQNSSFTSIPSLNANDASTKALADQMRIAAVMLQQLDSSGQANSEQSIAIKNRIVESMIALQDQFDSIDYDKLNQLQGDHPSAGERKLENDFKLGEDWNLKKQRIRKSSAYGHLENWDLCSVIAKNGDDLPQEAFACQLITMISNIWKNNAVPVWTKRMKILITSANTGLVETIINAMSVHSIKKSLTELSIKSGENTKGRIFTLLDYYENVFGPPESSRFKIAQENFAKSLAAYSIICYVLQIKDRHNGNIMVDGDGHIIHIDFGFLLSNSPGSVGFEAAPFKLTAEYVDLLGGSGSVLYNKFVSMCKQCFKVLRTNSEEIIEIVELMQKDSSLPCFNNGENTSVLLKQRLQLHLSEDEVDLFVESVLIGKSLGSMYTRLYDQFQMITQGIYS